MSAIVYQGARHANASTAGVTETDLSYPGVAFGRNLLDQARQAIAGISPLEDFLGGGAHPETAVGVAPAVAVEQPTDSVRGPLGGLKPNPASTVAPGPAGQAAQARKSFAESLKALFSAAPAPTTPPRNNEGLVNSGYWDGQLGHPSPAGHSSAWGGVPNPPILGGQRPAYPGGGPFPRDPGLPIGYG